MKELAPRAALLGVVWKQLDCVIRIKYGRGLTNPSPLFCKALLQGFEMVSTRFEVALTDRMLPSPILEVEYLAYQL